MKKIYLLLLPAIIACESPPPQEDPLIIGKYCFYHPALGYTEIVFDDSSSHAYSETQKVLGSTSYLIRNDSFFNDKLPGGAKMVWLSRDTLIFKIPLRSDTFFRLENDLFTYHDVRKGNLADFEEFSKGFEARARIFKAKHGVYKK
jgi:hypothetical protein